MDIYILISALTLIHSWMMCTALSAPAGQTPTASTRSTDSTHSTHSTDSTHSTASTHSTDSPLRRHVRTKRCSCATFMDNECVYFCHLDIIWVNTPERVVAYGLGNAPRRRRALPDAKATREEPRCQCLRRSDVTCRSFCRLESRPRSETSPDARGRSAAAGRDACAEAQCKPQRAAGTRTQRTRSGIDEKRASPLATGAALRTRLLLAKWRARQRRRARAWGGESAAAAS
ncbi:endothelin-1 [Pseudoliparis swirei]|uniref:endothelin-1 n=1 Tax=Pseudoliparis swirei TaxID=2059687 RepID=UPI0024BEA050|nr:endothelin-1 [Pseudoliparis swirei]